MPTIADRLLGLFRPAPHENGDVAKAAAPSRVAIREELGTTGLMQSGGRIYEEFLDKLRGLQAVRAYREMSENDAIVGAMLTMIETLLRGATHDVEPGNNTPEAKGAADWLRTVPGDMSHSWASFISEWMATPIYGFAPFEIVLKLRNGSQRTPGESSRYTDGKIGVRKLAIRHPDTIDRWLFDDHMGVQGLVQRSPDAHYRPVTIPIEKLLMFRARSRKGNPEGTSLLRSAYISYFRKKRIEDIEAIGVERDLGGIPMVYAPAQWFRGDASAEDKAALSEMKKIVRNVRNDQQAGLVMPSVFDTDSQQRLLSFELVTTGGRRLFDTSVIIERLSRHIAMTLLQDVILIGHEQVGSFALASSKTNLAALVLGSFLDDIDETLNRHLVPRLMRLNGFPTDERMPRFTHGDIETRDLAELGAFFQALAGAGMPLFPSEDGQLEAAVYRMAGLPVPAEFVGRTPDSAPEDTDEEVVDENAPARTAEGGSAPSAPVPPAKPPKETA